MESVKIAEINPGDRLTKSDLYERGIVIHRFSTPDNCISYDIGMSRVYHFRSPAPDAEFTLQKILK